jgi:hypothetical protein
MKPMKEAEVTAKRFLRYPIEDGRLQIEDWRIADCGLSIGGFSIGD